MSISADHNRSQMTDIAWGLPVLGTLLIVGSGLGDLARSAYRGGRSRRAAARHAAAAQPEFRDDTRWAPVLHLVGDDVHRRRVRPNPYAVDRACAAGYGADPSAADTGNVVTLFPYRIPEPEPVQRPYLAFSQLP